MAGLRLGLTAGVPEALYHRGIVDGEPSLSHSGMKTLLGKTLSHFRREIDHPEDRVQKKEFDLGSAAHAYVLGAEHSSGLAEIRHGGNDQSPYGTGDPYQDFRTKDAQNKKAAAYSNDLIPILAKDISRVQAMVAALREHKKAGELLEPGSGLPEVSAIARDTESKVLVRARFDWLRHDGIAVDYKTISRTSASPARFGRTGFDNGYYLQAAVYEHVAALCGAPITAFEFVIQETTPPYAVSVTHFGPASIELGRLHMRQAIAMYAGAQASGSWPGWPEESVEVDVPFWALSEAGIKTSTTSYELSGDSTDASGLLDALERILAE